MSRVRGGSNSTLIRVGSRAVKAWTNRIDICIPLDQKALNHMQDRLNQDTLILADKSNFSSDRSLVDTGLSKIAEEAGGNIYSNTVAAGLLWGTFELDLKILEKSISKQFSDKEEEVLQKILTSAGMGYQKGLQLRKDGKINLRLPDKPESPAPFFMNGAQAVGLGAISGGCNFVSSYPMSPSTGVLVFMAANSKEFAIAVEQAEDEICAANMVLGAWYAGARAIATTSGGGFALMSEAISLGGMTETPMVLHLAQRPGPATGLPTRTEQGDLNLALHSGHGEFPRIILAPGNLEHAIELTRKAFILADEWQTPVIILTDQYLMDSCYDLDKPELPKKIPENSIVETPKDYLRYRLTDTGISERGVPGYGQGLVCVDSDEHDESGHITESWKVRNSMVEKRMKKLAAIEEKSITPTLYGKEGATNVFVCWGSPLEAALEALESIDSDDVAVLHFSQVYPLSPHGRKYLEKAKKAFLIEGNATGQFGKLLSAEWQVEWTDKILQFDGFQFAAEELQKAMELAIGKEESK
jgi:2-oxoglutarate ferredoxin oxidoreductase subunit alpha